MKRCSHFTPGGRQSTARLIQYVAWNPNATTCYCMTNTYDKSKPGTDSCAYKATQSQRLTQLVQSAKGGRTQYGNLYLGKPPSVNALGRMEGMPGGSGSPPVNKF